MDQNSCLLYKLSVYRDREETYFGQCCEICGVLCSSIPISIQCLIFIMFLFSLFFYLVIGIYNKSQKYYGLTIQLYSKIQKLFYVTLGPVIKLGII